jgi:hypothetical protein
MWKTTMGEIIHMDGRRARASGNLITAGPLEFRRAGWGAAQFIQMRKVLSEKLEADTEDDASTGSRVARLPPHFTLSGGTGYTIRNLFLYRDDPLRLQEVYYLVGLVDCMINQTNPVLRTDVIRAMYKTIFQLKQELNARWYGPMDQILLPIDGDLHNESEYRAGLRSARTLQELYRRIREGTDRMLDVLACEYVFYCPHLGG